MVLCYHYECAWSRHYLEQVEHVALCSCRSITNLGACPTTAKESEVSVIGTVFCCQRSGITYLWKDLFADRHFSDSL